MAFTVPIRDPDDVQALLNYYKDRKEYRNYLLVSFAAHTALRISDILKLKWCDVYDYTKKRFRTSVRIFENKTGKSKSIYINDSLLMALGTVEVAKYPQDPVFANRKGGALSRVQAYRLIRTAGEELGLPARVSAHSLRKTFGYHAWQNGASPAVIMEIYQHSDYNVTRRYLGVAQDDLNEVYQNMDCFYGQRSEQKKRLPAPTERRTRRKNSLSNSITV